MNSILCNNIPVHDIFFSCWYVVILWFYSLGKKKNRTVKLIVNLALLTSRRKNIIEITIVHSVSLILNSKY